MHLLTRRVMLLSSLVALSGLLGCQPSYTGPRGAGASFSSASGPRPPLVHDVRHYGAAGDGK
jgi:hypothetical protein